MMMMRSRSTPAFYPSSDELEAAEALLLLSNVMTAKDAKMFRSNFRSSSLNSLSAAEQSSVYASIWDPLSSELPGSNPRHDPLHILSVAASFHWIDAMGMQKVTEKVINQTSAKFTKPKFKPAISDDTSPTSSESSAGSSITTTTSAANVTETPYIPRRARTASMTTITTEKRLPPKAGPSRLWRKSEEIVEFLTTLSNKAVTEAQIRTELGNGPDTSKALRLLVKHCEVKRFGTGGKKSPYLYMPNKH